MFLVLSVAALYYQGLPYAMYAVIRLSMKDMAPFIALLSATSTLTDKALSFNLFIRFSKPKMYCNPATDRTPRRAYPLKPCAQTNIIVPRVTATEV